MPNPDYYDHYTLDHQGPDLVALVQQKRIEFTYERTDLLAHLAALLQERNVLLVGEEGVGKRSLVRALAYRIFWMRKELERIQANQAPLAVPPPEEAVLNQIFGYGAKPELMLSHFPYGALYATNPMTLAAGAPYAGDMTEKIHRVGENAAERKAILFIDDIHLASGTGSYQGNANRDVANVLLAALERHRFRLIGATTPQGLQALEMNSPALRSHLAVLDLAGVRRDELSPWLQRFEDHLSRRGQARFAPGFTAEILDTCDLFFTAQPYPGKALNLIREILLQRTAERTSQGDPIAGGDAVPVLLEPGDVHRHVSMISGLAPEMVAREPVPRAWIEHGLPLFFGERIIGQPAAVEAAVMLVARYRARLLRPNKPIAVLWLAGPTGVGKTEFAKVVAEFFFGSRERLLRYDMSEFKTREGLVRLVGGPTGESAVPREPSLVQKIRAQPFAVLLFDEIEKANDEILDLFLQLFDEAKLTGADGKAAHFDNTIVLLTSNLGQELFDPAPGMGFTGTTARAPGAEAIREALMGSYRPEFINRIEVIVPFGRLSRDDVAGILKVQIAELGRLPGFAGIRRLHLSEDIHEAILRDGYQPRFGARPLRRAIDDHVLRPLSFLLATEAAAGADTVAVSAAGAKFVREGGAPPAGWLGFAVA